MAQWMPGNSWGRAPQRPSSHCLVHSCKYRVPVLQLPKPADSQLLSLCAEACAPRACSVQFSSVQFSHSAVSYSLRPHGPQHTTPPCPSPTPRVHPNITESVMPFISSSVVPSSSCPQSFPAQGVFKWVSSLVIRWPKYWSFSFSISPSNEHSGLISFRMDWLDLLAVQGTPIQVVTRPDPA